MTQRPIQPLKNKPNNPGRDGVVYFLEMLDGGPIKIGFTQGSPLHRLAYYQQACPGELRWIGYFRGKRRDELTLHGHFKEHRIRAEWFRPADEIKEYIEGVCPDFDAQEAIEYLLQTQVRQEIRAGLRLNSEELLSRQTLDECLRTVGLDNEQLWAWMHDKLLPTYEVIVKARHAVRLYQRAAA